MRFTVFGIKTVVILSFVVLGAAFAQQGVPQPGGGPSGTGRVGGPGAGAPGVRGTAPPAAAADVVYRQQVSYVLGRNFGDSLRTNEVDLDLQTLVAGLSDALNNAQPRWTDAELQAAMQRFDQEMRQKATARNKRQAAAFLAENRLKEGVHVTASGLQYKVLYQGAGASPTLGDEVLCHYRGMLLDGSVFESSVGGPPAQFRVGQVIAGWTEALQKMHVGDRWQLFVPSELAYGDNPDPRSGIEPGAMLIFEVELLEIVQH